MATLVSKAGVRRIILLTLGWEELPKSVSVYGAPPEERMREPVPGVLLQTDGGWVLLDTGFNTALVRDPALYRRFFPTVEYRPVLPGPGEPIEQRLAEVGVDFDDIHTVAVSHLHHDHAGGLKLFAGKVPVHAQRRELEYGLSNHPEPERNAIVRVDFDDPNIEWRLADGEAEIAPGITAVPTYGHTPGHQSFVVELDESVTGGEGAGIVFAFDAADLTENIEHELAIGGFIDVEPEETIEPIRRLKRLASDKGYQLIPGHDPHVWPELTRALPRPVRAVSRSGSGAAGGTGPARRRAPAGCGGGQPTDSSSTSGLSTPTTRRRSTPDCRPSAVLLPGFVDTHVHVNEPVPTGRASRRRPPPPQPAASPRWSTCRWTPTR